MFHRFSKVIAIILTVSIVACFSEECSTIQSKGKLAAEVEHSSVGWFLGGVASGVLLGIIGTGVITGASAMSRPQPKLIPDDYDRNCYIKGYSSKGKTKNIWSALGGGLLGTAAFVAVVAISSAN